MQVDHMSTNSGSAARAAMTKCKKYTVVTHASLRNDCSCAGSEPSLLLTDSVGLKAAQQVDIYVPQVDHSRVTAERPFGEHVGIPVQTAP